MSRAKIFAIIASVGFAALAGAQTPTPAPPTPSLPPVAPVPSMPPLEPMEPLPAVAPTPPLPPMDFDFDFDDDMSFDLAVPAPDIRVDLGDLDIDVDVAARASSAVAAIAPAIARASATASRVSAPAIARAMSRVQYATTRAVTALSSDAIAPAITTSLFERQFGTIASVPQEGWSSADPADSLYRVARETLNRGEYRRASQLFDEIAQKFPSSVYAGDARYWKAFALYRIGSAVDLREALRSLESGSGRYSSALKIDAPTLATRIRGALAARGDDRAATYIQREASQPTSSCDREDVAVRVEALNSLGQMDPASVTPMLRRLLQRKDECSASLRRSALFLLARRGDADALSLLTTAAKSDPDIRVRADAIRWLARMPGDQSVPVLEDLIRTADNPDIQEAAIEALGSSDSPRARASIRALIERTDVAEPMRVAALQSFDEDRTDDNGAYLRSVYPRLETPRLQIADIRAIARVGGPDNEQWLLSLVRNTGVSLDVRRTALSYAGRSTIAIGDLVKMYDSMADRPLREALLSLYARRSEPEATDKLIDIAKNGTDPELRRLAISNLSRKNDPRAKKLLLEIIDK